MHISRLILKLLRYRLSWLFTKFQNKKKIKNIKLINLGGPPRKCIFQAFIIQSLDIMTLKLGMKV
jgi:hypothetical protein